MTDMPATYSEVFAAVAFRAPTRRSDGTVLRQWRSPDRSIESRTIAMTVKIAMIYYSATGNVHKLAEAVAEGAEKAGADMRLRRWLSWRRTPPLMPIPPGGFTSSPSRTGWRSPGTTT